MKCVSIIAALWAGTAAAQDDLCANRADLVAGLEQQFGEVSIGQGLDARGVMVEVFVSQRGTFTLLITTPDGNACMTAAGDSWIFIEQPWPKQGSVN